jgi:hypothetical protein
MKRVIIIASALLCGHSLIAAEGINSRVIHDYTEFGVAYGYLDDLAGGNGHGILAHTSVDMNNLLFSVNGNYFWGEEDVDVWSAGGAIGYVFRPMRNHINIIPQFGMGYSQAIFDSFEDGSTTISPGITVSYAFNNRLSVNANYTYVRGIDDEFDVHGYGGGARFAVTERLGIDAGANFAESQGFVGAFAGVSWHF